jgi:RHS repeat-associated protein
VRTQPHLKPENQEKYIGGVLTNDTYTYDIANRLVDVNGVEYTWDDNGNLLNDGVNTYDYDSANRLATLTGPSVTVQYSYNGLGDRLQETVNGDTTTFTMDLNTGLTQALSDGTYTYLYGNGRIAQSQIINQQSQIDYFLGDALNSVRQMTNATGAITYARSYDPYGVVAQTAGASQTAYGYTAEWSDPAGKVYLRARHYAPSLGRFLARDPSGLEENLYFYGASNPINRSDPTGLDSSLLGPWAFSMCFDLHSLWKGSYPWISAGRAVAICQTGFRQDAWNPGWFNLSGNLPQSAHDLMGWYLFERGDKPHLDFDGNQPLAKELARSTLIHDVRMRYYFTHGDTSGKMENRFGYGEFIRSIVFDMKNVGKLSLPITFFLGSFYYQVVTLPGDKVGFRIDNSTDLASGTHIVGRFDDNYHGSVEELIHDGVIDENKPLSDVVREHNVISILSARTRDETSDPLGGGNLYQTYTWIEKRSACPELLWLDYIKLPEPEVRDGFERMGFSFIQPWPNYQAYTKPVYEGR